MTSLSRRLKRLEGSYHLVTRQASGHARNLESAIMKRVLEHLSDDDLRLLRDIAEAMHQGSFNEEMLATDQWAALNRAYDAALDEECRKVGFTSSADFRRLKAV